MDLARGGFRLFCAVLQCGPVSGSHEELSLDVRPALDAARHGHLRRRKDRPAGGGSAMKQLILLGRLIFGAWMLASGANYFFVPLWPQPIGHEPLAIQL